ncbi:MAG: hypothetical protein IPP51_05365 [Bacteroidetes bacterium]|nr:hypothetical protein [Bacteroidota bacterium]
MSLNKNLPPISTALSLLCSETVVLTAPVVAGALLTNNLSSLWFLWSAVITGVVGWVFFARLWPRLPLQVENEFLRFRYGGNGSKLLLHFRSVLISFIIVPFFISWLILSAQRILQELFGLDSIFTTGVILAIPLMLIPVNNIFDRVRQDSFFFLIIALALFSATIILFIDYNPGETVAMLKRNGISSKAFEFPSAIGNDLWFYLLVFWWIAYLPDLPDLDGQKLMKTTEPRFAVSTVGFFRIGSLIIQIPLIYLAFVAASRSLQGDNGEQSIYQFLSASSNFTLRFLFGVAWLLAIGVIIMNKIRWGADVISVIVGKWKTQIDEKKGEHILVAPSIMIYVISILLWTQTSTFVNRSAACWYWCRCSASLLLALVLVAY